MKEQRTKELLHRGQRKAVGDLVTAGSALLVSSLLLIILLSLFMRKEMIDDAMVQTKMVATNSNAALLFSDDKAGQEILSSLGAAPSVQSAAIFSTSGDILARYRQDDAPALAWPTHSLIKSGHSFSLRHLDVIQAIRSNDETIGYVVARFGLAHFYQRLLGYMVLILGVALGALLIVYLFVSRMRLAVSRAELHLDYLAYYDPVTSLLNRRGFNEKLADAIDHADSGHGEVGLILMDLDNFKVVNDTMGHACGDEILRMVAQRLLSAARSTDTVCRIGGDEFAIIMQQRDDGDHDLAGIAVRVMKVLSDPFLYEDHEFYITSSIGCSLYPRDARDSETLMRKADTAMYWAKTDGKNTYAIFRAEMDEAAQRRLQLESSLRKSLDAGELALHYQPQVELPSGRIVGVEALLRWHHPELGMISPADFIPVAEESGLIVDIGKWVLQAACRQMVAWRNAGVAPMRIAVNLSARQVKDPSFLSDLNAALVQSGLSPLLLELEITEGVLMENVQTNIRLLRDLQTAGISLSIDDFGTGYSSLSYLKRFPINQLKIDRSFIHDIPGGGETFVTAIVAMAHSLGLSVVAEGVETEAQRQFLLEVGCNIGQGYHFSRPIPPHELAPLLHEGRIGTPTV